MNTAATMPALFIGHGSPMNTLETNRYTSVWRALGRSLPRPRAILVISAHWYVEDSAVTAMQSPPTIHDFRGFPKPLFDFAYPAPGAPDIAREIVECVKPGQVALDADSWGLDHGTWSVLAHLFPQADIPVLQLSIHAGEDIDYHIELGKRLAPLRDAGILIVGSGNVVHNLRRIDWTRPDGAFDWAEDFDAHVKHIMTSRPDALRSVEEHSAYAMAVPTPEHFLPLAYLAGLAKAAGEPARAFLEGGTMGSLTMTSYVLGNAIIAQPTSDAEAAEVPSPAVIAPEATNI